MRLDLEAFLHKAKALGYDGVELMGKRPHLSPLDVTPERAVPMGDGSIDYSAFFRGLRDGGYGGRAAYEMCSPLRSGGSIGNLDACAARFVGYVKQLG